MKSFFSADILRNLHNWWISPTFYEQFFRMKVFRKAFLYLQFMFVIFWYRKIGKKAARNMLVKLANKLREKKVDNFNPQ